MLIPVILAGGAGTRLWPVSREAHPKQFVKMTDGLSLLQKTYLRAANIEGISEILTVTNQNYYFKTKDEYFAVGKAAIKTTFMLEPVGRNTAPAIALAAMKIADELGPDAQLLVMPADHLISDNEAFASAIAKATELAASGALVTFGIQPTAPETGFGYIEAGDPRGQAYSVVRFIEKPDLETAKRYLASGRFFWNSGIFCFNARTLIEEMKKTCPAVLKAAASCWKATQAAYASRHSMIELDRTSFERQPDISIDFAVMEKAKTVAVIPCDMGWSDIGSWKAMQDLVPPDAMGNRSVGDVLLVDCKNTFVHSENQLVAAVGIEDLIVVDTQDAILIAHKDKTQDVREIVQQLKQIGHDAFRLHRTVYRPWGSYTVLEEGPRFKIKRLVVKPGASLSLQMHYHRSEHWVVVHGMAQVTNGNGARLVNTNESTFIPAGHSHRVENPGVLDLIMIEVQSGDYLGEDDIVRFDDEYGRS